MSAPPSVDKVSKDIAALSVSFAIAAEAYRQFSVRATAMDAVHGFYLSLTVDRERVRSKLKRNRTRWKGI